MTRVLKIPRLGGYVTKSGRCTPEFSAACRFPDVPSAVEFCRRHKLNRVEMLIRTDAPEYDLSIPLRSDG
jgi:hypothetical protein